MLVQSSSMLELVEIAMSTFDSHTYQEVSTFLSWATCINENDRMSKHLAMLLH